MLGRRFSGRRRATCAIGQILAQLSRSCDSSVLFFTTSLSSSRPHPAYLCPTAFASSGVKIGQAALHHLGSDRAPLFIAREIGGSLQIF